jgi:hypothetical protein
VPRFAVKIVRRVIEERIVVVDAADKARARKRACAIERGETSPQGDESDGEWEHRHATKNHVLWVKPEEEM